MKIWLLMWIVVFISPEVFAEERGPAVMVGLVSGKEIRFRLDHIDENKVIGFKPGPERIILSRSEISWMRFRPEVPKKIPSGQEGMLLTDGTVVIGTPIWMDEKYYWVEDGDFKRKRIELKKVVFIQLANSKDTIRIPSASNNAVTSQVRVDASRNWTGSNLSVRPGQQVWFTVGEDSLSSCSGSSQAVTAAGVRDSSNTNLPVPSANACSLIGKIGEQGKPFFVGFQRTPVIAETSGQLFLGVNDNNFEDNKGLFDVFVKIMRPGEELKSSQPAAPEEKNASNHP